ncbi:MAG: asparagine synthetase B, partial [Nitrospirae bacterium]
MCGIAGFVSRQAGPEAAALCHDMIDALVHRGPDDGGVWSEPSSGVVMGHRRLAILDLSPRGNQPMHSSSGRYVVAYNGEIYNFLRLQKELELQGARFCGHSDTEVLLAAVEAWGVRGAVEQFVGMFAFALWDREERTLWLARDRIGEKPLYYGWQGKSFLFGSELKALRRHPDWQGEIDRDVLALFMRHNYVPGPWSIYRGIRKLLPGTLLCFQVGTPPGTLPEPEAYWSAAQVVEQGLAHPFEGGEREAVDALESLLLETIADKMISDVPLG